MRLPAWSWAFVLFRVADGLSHALLPIYPVFVLGMDIWTVPLTAAVMNLVAVPGSFLWGTLMERTRGVGRRRLAMAGFGFAGIAMLGLIVPGPFWLFLVAVALFTLLGVATAPAASVLSFEVVPGKRWAEAAGHLAQRTGIAYVAGGTVVTLFGLAGTDITALSRTAFAITALLSLVAAVIAAATIEPAAGPLLPRRNRDATLMDARAAGRRFERAVWFPARWRLRIRPGTRTFADGHPRLLLLAYFLMFAGTGILFAAYPGVLAGFGLTPGLILLAQLPSSMLGPVAHAWAGRASLRVGDLGVVSIGLWLRAACIPVIVVSLLVWSYLGAAALPLLLVAHGVAGVSFAFLQTGGSVAMAKAHRAGRGAGIGNFHAAVGLGVLLGSSTAFLLVLAWPLVWMAGLVLLLLGAGLILAASVRHSPHFDARNVLDPDP